MSKENLIHIRSNETLEKLLLVKDYKLINHILINEKRTYNENLIKEFLKFKNLKYLSIDCYNDDDLSELANLQLLNSLSTHCYYEYNKISNDNCIISKDGKNAIVVMNNKTNLEKIMLKLNLNIENITIIHDNFSIRDMSIYDNLLQSCKNIRVVIQSTYDFATMIKSFRKDLKFTNLPFSTENINIIFYKITKRVGDLAKIYDKDEKMRNLLEQEIISQIKLPLNCKLNVTLE